MANNWTTHELNTLRDPDRIITYGIVKVGSFIESGVPVIRGGDIRDGQVVFDDAKRVTPEVSNKFSRTILRGGELVINLIAEPGHVAIVPDDFAGYNVSRDVAVIPLNDSCDHRFVMYVLRSPKSIDWLASRMRGSVTQKINLETLRAVPIDLPPYPEQQAAADALGSIERKIQLNHLMNQTLEELAWSIFKAWFVDFEPIKAKANGVAGYLGMSNEVFEKLPREFEEGDLGTIPAGWSKASVAEIARYVNGKAFTKFANGKGRMITRIAELNSGPGPSTKYSDVDSSPDHMAIYDDILFAWSGSLGVHRWHRNEALINQHIFKVIPNDRPNWYVFFRLKEAMPYFKNIAATKATTMGHIKRAHLGSEEFAEPPDWLINAADLVIRPIYDHIHKNERESLSLAETLDSLLPGLTSGEIPVSLLKSEAGQAL